MSHGDLRERIEVKRFVSVKTTGPHLQLSFGHGREPGRRASVASLRARTRNSYQWSNPRMGETTGPVEKKLRLHRDYSIKLMLAWESVCRFTSRHPFPSPPFPSRASANLKSQALGSGILFAYPQLATITGVQGVVIYALSSAAPLLIFAWLAPIIRRKCPEGFVLTEWTRQRYGLITAIYLSFLTLATMFLYMTAELSALGQIMTALTGMDGLPMVVVQCVVTTIYTCKCSECKLKCASLTTRKLLEDSRSLSSRITSRDRWLLGSVSHLIPSSNALSTYIYWQTPVILATITIGANTKIDKSLVDSSPLLQPSLLGWQLLYILPVALLTNTFFLSNFWIRAFASKTDRDLWIGVPIAALTVLCILTLVGVTGLVATWSGAFDPANPKQDGSIAFFLLLGNLPAWTVGIVLVMVVSLSTAAFDSFQSAMVSTASNDLFRNRLNIWLIRLLVVLLIFPVVVIALRAPSVLQIYLISDLVSASTIPVLILGLMDRFYWWRGFEVVVGGLGGLLTVFIFGTVYYGDALKGAKLLLLQDGLYADDWSVFGAFVAAPVGGLLWAAGALGVRLSYRLAEAKIKGTRFDALDRPARPEQRVEGVTSENADQDGARRGSRTTLVTVDHTGKFF